MSERSKGDASESINPLKTCFHSSASKLANNKTQFGSVNLIGKSKFVQVKTMENNEAPC